MNKEELKEENELLKEGISDEIDNLREELRKIKKRNLFLEKQAVDYQENFIKDRILFSNQLKEIKELKKEQEDETSNLKDVCANCGKIHKGLSYPWLCKKFKPVKEVEYDA